MKKTSNKILNKEFQAWKQRPSIIHGGTYGHPWSYVPPLSLTKEEIAEEARQEEKSSMASQSGTSENERKIKLFWKMLQAEKENEGKAGKTSSKTKRITRPKKLSVYQKSKITHHLTYVFEDDGKDKSFVGITHSNETNRIQNVPLPDNPDPNDKSPSFALPRASKHDRHCFQKPKKWEVTKANKTVFESIIKKTKK